MIERIVVPDWCRAPRVHPISLVLTHATRGNAPQDQQYGATVNWFKQGGGGSAAQGWGAAADVLIGHDGRIAEFVDSQGRDWRTTRANWSAGFGGRGSPVEVGADEHAISIELAQSAAGEPFSEACIAAYIAYVRPLLTEFGIPPWRVPFWTQIAANPVPKGLVGHQDTANGKAWRKSDPGSQFPWDRVIAELSAPTSPPPSSGGLDVNVVGTRIEREYSSRYLGYDRTRPAEDGAVGSEVHEIVIREYVYRPAP